jgi:hypothetical protein
MWYLQSNEVNKLPEMADNIFWPAEMSKLSSAPLSSGTAGNDAAGFDRDDISDEDGGELYRIVLLSRHSLPRAMK